MAVRIEQLSELLVHGKTISELLHVGHIHIGSRLTQIAASGMDCRALSEAVDKLHFLLQDIGRVIVLPDAEASVPVKVSGKFSAVQPTA